MAERTIEDEERRSITVGGSKVPLNFLKKLDGDKPRKYRHRPPALGGIYWTGKPKSSVKDTDRERLNSTHSSNVNRKRRPWIIVEEFPDGRVLVMSSTTQGRKGWDAVAEEHQQFFLPIYPTASNGRPVLRVEEDFERSFVGMSLLYLCIEVVIPASELCKEHCLGYLDRSAVSIIQRERRRVREAERAARSREVRKERFPKNAGYLQGNRADRTPVRPGFANDSRTRSAGRLDRLPLGCSARGFGTALECSHIPSRIGFRQATDNQDTRENHRGQQSHNLLQDSHSRAQLQTQTHGWNESSSLQNSAHLQSRASVGSSDPSLGGWATFGGVLDELESPGQARCGHQTGERGNKNGSQKRRERVERRKLLLEGQ